MPPSPAEFAAQVANPMGCYYLLAAAANGVAAGAAWKRKHRAKSIAWIPFAFGFGFLAGVAFWGSPLEMPHGLKIAIDAVCTSAILSCSFFAMFLLLFVAREFFAKPAVAWIGFNAVLLFFGASLTDPNFFAAVMRPDDVPIVAMVFLLGSFLWSATYQAVENDRRALKNMLPVEKEYSEKVLVWPDLVYPELICMIAVSALLIIWSLLLRAPLEQPANPSLTPNPSKAPWYFVGLQELLTYSDAWNAGVVVPALAILGLAAIPYIGSRTGSGYYSIRGRRFACLVFLFGFLQLWIVPILIGTFFRGPNWSCFGLYEARDLSKIVTLEHLSLSQVFWSDLLNRPMPQSPAGSGTFTEFLYFLYRNIPGVSLTLFYFLALPPILGRTLMKRSRQSLGRVRFYLMTFLLLYMCTLPIKMLLQWLFGLDSLFG